MRKIFTKTKNGKKKPGRKKNLTSIDCIIYIARLGGFLARKGDGFPGPEKIWKGLVRFLELKRLESTGLMTYV